MVIALPAVRHRNANAAAWNVIFPVKHMDARRLLQTFTQDAGLPAALSHGSGATTGQARLPPQGRTRWLALVWPSARPLSRPWTRPHTRLGESGDESQRNSVKTRFSRARYRRREISIPRRRLAAGGAPGGPGSTWTGSRPPPAAATENREAAESIPRRRRDVPRPGARRTPGTRSDRDRCSAPCKYLIQLSLSGGGDVRVREWSGRRSPPQDYECVNR